MEKKYFFRAMNRQGEQVMKTVIIPLVLGVALSSCSRVDPHIEKGIANLELGDYKRARRHFEAILDKKPASFVGRLGLGKALLQEFSARPGDSTLLLDCCTQLEAARTLRPDREVEKLLSVVWFKRATWLLTNHDTIAAMAALSRSTGFDPKASKPVNLAGILYFHRGEHDKALNLFRMVTAMDSGSVNGYFNTGMVYWADGNCALAYDFWYKAALRAPEDKEILTWAAIAKKRSQIPRINGIAPILTKEKERPMEKTRKPLP
jgi:tetratricopeptide (TPR) repeat protein